MGCPGVGATWDQVAGVAGGRHKPSAIQGIQRYFERLPDLENTPERRRLWRDRLEVLRRQSMVDVHEQRPVRSGPGSPGLNGPQHWTAWTPLPVYTPTSVEILEAAESAGLNGGSAPKHTVRAAAYVPPDTGTSARVGRAPSSGGRAGFVAAVGAP